MAAAGTRVPERRGMAYAEASSCLVPATARPRMETGVKRFEPIDSLEDQVMARVSMMDRQRAAERREADRLMEFSMTNLEAVERRQVQLETTIADLTGTVTGLKQELQRRQEASFQACEERLRALEEHASSASASAKAYRQDYKQSMRTLQKRLDMQEEHQNQQLKLLEGLIAAEARHSQVEKPVAASPKDKDANSTHQELRRPGVGHGQAGVSGMAPGEVALLVMEEVEVLLQKELKVIQKKCMAIQDVIDERVLEPLNRVEQRLAEQEQKIRELMDGGQESSSRVEEHEFRLGVTRTKLEVHDQKLAILDRALRWNRSLDPPEDSGRPGAQAMPADVQESPQRPPVHAADAQSHAAEDQCKGATSPYSACSSEKARSFDLYSASS
mmetsp:Transcript_121625/g.214440  ORF Transcript_121625/g.214440 Transcript_121625/m.214440 type:complete len:387 (+) Transcript_121625:169-1329(+)